MINIFKITNNKTKKCENKQIFPTLFSLTFYNVETHYYFRKKFENNAQCTMLYPISLQCLNADKTATNMRNEINLSILWPF